MIKWKLLLWNKMAKNCPICAGTKTEKKSCGYTTFDPTWIECTTCEFRVGIYYTKDFIQASNWNNGVDKAQAILAHGSMMTRRDRQLIDIDVTYDALMKMIKEWNKKNVLLQKNKNG
jgi:hypothetical protein